eukprot:6148949-Amphidinium_carterae.1
MTCKKCGRYVTSYKGTWRNLGTIARQPCKPKARRLKGYEGKAARKQPCLRYLQAPDLVDVRLGPTKRRAPRRHRRL